MRLRGEAGRAAGGWVGGDQGQRSEMACQMRLRGRAGWAGRRAGGWTGLRVRMWGWYPGGDA